MQHLVRRKHNWFARRRSLAIRACALAIALTTAACSLDLPCAAQASSQPLTPSQASTPADQAAKRLEANGRSTKPAADQSKPQQSPQSATTPNANGEEAASPRHLTLGPLDPSTPPTDLPNDRPVIGLALGGGGAQALSEIGVLQWFDEHHIPVDVIAGTSMGSIIGALYATGHTPEEMKHIMTEDSVYSVFRIEQAYTAQNFRRREDTRDIPNGITVGLKHGIEFRNSLLTESGLNELLEKEFLRYNDQTDFNHLPIPFRCQATDLTAAKTVTFSRGSLRDAVLASASIPGVFRPFELDGHAFVDGAILENLPTQDVKAMDADVVLAVSLKLSPIGKGDLNSILGVLQRAFAVGIENNEERDRKLANVVITPDVSGFSAASYLKVDQLAARGYAAAESDKAELLKYAITPAQWKRYIEQRNARMHGPPGNVLRVEVNAPNPGVKAAAERLFAPLVDQPVNTQRVDTLLAKLRSDGRYAADYTVGYDRSERGRPILLVTVHDKTTGPPFLDVGFNLQAQTGGVTRATINTILLDQDLGGYGSELRTYVDFGFSTRVESEYYRKLDWQGFFLAPRANITRTPYYIYSGNIRLSERLAQFVGPAADVGWSNGSTQEVRAGWKLQNVRWYTTTGLDGLPDYRGNAQTGRVQYIFDSEDRALVPHYGIRSQTDLGYLYGTPGSPNAPQLSSQIAFAHTFAKKNLFLMNMEGGTLLHRNVAQPFRFTLGGPLRVSAAAIDQYRGTDYFLVTPGYLRRIKSLPAPLGNSLYLGGFYEAGQMRAPDASTITEQDVFFGVIAETPLGVVSIGPAIGTHNERKLVFTIGKFF
ncbi:MAG: patatin-like phospholipase family protein [Acidobacteriaceae bacterium]